MGTKGVCVCVCGGGGGYRDKMLNEPFGSGSDVAFTIK